MDGSHSLLIRSQQFGIQVPQGGHPPHHSITSSASASRLVRHCKAKLLGGLEIDREHEFSRLLHRKIGGLGPLEKSARIGTGEAIIVSELGTVAHQAAGQDELAKFVDCRNRIVRRQRH